MKSAVQVSTATYRWWSPPFERSVNCSTFVLVVTVSITGRSPQMSLS
jgi:hypothetical protein